MTTVTCFDLPQCFAWMILWPKTTQTDYLGNSYSKIAFSNQWPFVLNECDKSSESLNCFVFS